MHLILLLYVDQILIENSIKILLLPSVLLLLLLLFIWFEWYVLLFFGEEETRHEIIWLQKIKNGNKIVQNLFSIFKNSLHTKIYCLQVHKMIDFNIKLLLNYVVCIIDVTAHIERQVIWDGSSSNFRRISIFSVHYLSLYHPKFVQGLFQKFPNTLNIS